MEDIGLFKQGWKWVQSKKHCYSVARNSLSCIRDKIGTFIDRNWPIICSECARLGRVVMFLSIQWKDCVVRGVRSFVQLGSAALLVIMWSCFLSLTSVSCLVYLLLSMGVAGAAIQYLGYTPGLFIVGLFSILILWMYANFWITGTLFIVGGYLFSLNHARLVVLMATVYAIYCVKVRVGWVGIFLSINLAFLSNDILNYLLQWCDNLSESVHTEEHKESEPFVEDHFSSENEYSVPTTDEAEKIHSCKSSGKSSATTTYVDKPKEPSIAHVVKEEVNSVNEMKHILNSGDHYEALGFPRHKKIDAALLKKEYHKKAMLVHPDKNMGSQLASESFKKLQCAYEVLSDSTKKRDYDEQLRKEESKRVIQKSPSSSNQDAPDYCSEESRRIHCTKCGNSHIWVCTNRSKAKARWCQDCCQYHQAKDGDGWVEYKGSLVFDRPQKGTLKNGRVVAVKVLSAESTQGVREFLTEIQVISAIEHENLVKLYGCCAEGDQRILVYNYLENNSLARTLLGGRQSSIHFNWKTRTKICIGVAKGLAFLHEEVQPYIVHRDIKASNILLDKDLTPKISDFGLAKLIPTDMSHVSTRVAGTIGYLAPEYAIRGQLTRKADIYSFGILLVEIVSGRCNMNTQLPVGEQYLIQRTWLLHERGELLDLVAKSLGGNFDAEEATRFLKIGLLCTQDTPKLRPSMSNVVKMLTGETEVEDNITRPGLISDLMELKIPNTPTNIPYSNINSDTTTTNTNTTSYTLSSGLESSMFSSTISTRATTSSTSIHDRSI